MNKKTLLTLRQLPSFYLTTLAAKIVSSWIAKDGDCFSATTFSLLRNLAGKQDQHPSTVDHYLGSEMRSINAAKEIISELGFTPKRILDYGSGDASITESLSKLLPSTDVIGYDKVAQNDSSKGFIKGKFDVIILRQVLHHLTYDAQVTLLRSLQEHLTTEGMFFIKEHDCSSVNTYIFIEFIHFIYAAREFNVKEDASSTLNNYYTSKYDFLAIFKGWTFLKNNPPKFTSKTYTIVVQKNSESLIGSLRLDATPKFAYENEIFINKNVPCDIIMKLYLLRMRNVRKVEYGKSKDKEIDAYLAVIKLYDIGYGSIEEAIFFKKYFGVRSDQFKNHPKRVDSVNFNRDQSKFHTDNENYAKYLSVYGKKAIPFKQFSSLTERERALFDFQITDKNIKLKELIRKENEKNRKAKNLYEKSNGTDVPFQDTKFEPKLNIKESNWSQGYDGKMVYLKPSDE